MDFELSDEQRLLQETVRRFVDERILPNAVENDIAHRLDLDAIEGMAELGILGIVIPEEYGAKRCRAKRSSAARRRSGR